MPTKTSTIHTAIARLAKEKPEFFYEKMEKNESLIARARHAALNSAGPNTPPERSQAAIERQLNSIHEAHGGDTIAYQQAVRNYYAGMEDASTVIVASQQEVIHHDFQSSSSQSDVQSGQGTTLSSSVPTEVESTYEVPEFTQTHLIAAQASLLAYGEPLEGIPLENQQVYNFDNLNGSAIVGNAEIDGERTLVIAFRGSDTPDFSQLASAFQDWASLRNIVIPSLGTMELLQNEHFQQFASELQNSSADFLTDIRNIDDHYGLFDSFTENVQRLIHNDGIQKVLVTGHSLGGAMAQMFMNSTTGNPIYQAVTFGSPGTSTDNADATDDRITNIIHGQDIAVFLAEQRGYERSGQDIQVPYSFRPVSAHLMRNYLETIEEHLVSKSES